MIQMSKKGSQDNSTTNSRPNDQNPQSERQLSEPRRVKQNQIRKRLDQIKFPNRTRDRFREKSIFCASCTCCAFCTCFNCYNATNILKIILAASLLKFVVWTIFLPTLFVIDVLLLPLDLLLSIFCLPCEKYTRFPLGKINGIAVFYLCNSINTLTHVPFEDRSWKSPVKNILRLFSVLTFIQRTIMYILHIIFVWKLGLFIYIMDKTKRIDVKYDEEDEENYRKYLNKKTAKSVSQMKKIDFGKFEQFFIEYKEQNQLLQAYLKPQAEYSIGNIIQNSDFELQKLPQNFECLIRQLKQQNNQQKIIQAYGLYYDFKRSEEQIQKRQNLQRKRLYSYKILQDLYTNQMYKQTSIIVWTNIKLNNPYCFLYWPLK